ncbi:RNase H domain-containing protein [Trichonephila clavipes]|nr:RNase H domain-containing protein [Trichonephila clavipes]
MTPHSLSQIIDPSEGLDGVYFHVDLSIQVSKQKELPCYLKQLALERINNLPKDAVYMYTDGSKLGSDCSGSGDPLPVWIPSHVNITGTKIVDSLARAGAGETTTPDASLTYLELFSKYKAKNKAIWMIQPLHPWYRSNGIWRLLGSGQQ